MLVALPIVRAVTVTVAITVITIVAGNLGGTYARAAAGNRCALAVNSITAVEAICA
jgi:hypothetical protein